MAKPRLWRPFENVSWAREYEHAHDGRIRDRSRNVLPVRGPDHAVTFNVRGGKYTAPAAHVLALEWYGYPGSLKCRTCGRRMDHRVIHRDGNPRNTSRWNITYSVNVDDALTHELICVPHIVAARPAGTPWGTAGYEPGCLSPMVLEVA